MRFFYEIVTFTYVQNNPINLVDPDGLQAIPIAPGGLPIFIPPGSVFEPGSPANDAFVDSTMDLLELFDPRPLANAIYDVCTGDTEEEQQRKNCQSLKNSILKTCAGLTGRAKFRCFAAADKSYRQCMGYE